MKKIDKKPFVEKLSETLKSTQSVYLVDYAGLGVASQLELKKRLKDAGSRFIVVKNTLFKLAAEEAKYPKETLTDTVLKGQTALILADEDPIKPLGVLEKFVKEFELPKIKVGIVEGSFQDKDQLANIAKLGGKDGILAQLIGVLMAPTYNLVSVTSAKLQELVFVLESVAKSK